MAVPTVQEFNDGKRDLDDLEALINGFITVATRLGGNKDSYSQIVANIIHGTIAAYNAGTTYTDIDTWVEQTGIAYRPLPSALPIGPEAFDSAKWIVVQGYHLGDRLHPSVDSYASLRAIPSASLVDGTDISVTDDGVAGRFIVKTGTVTDNGGTRIVFTDDSNRYVERDYSGGVHVTWFGADKTGTTDSTTQIQACFDYIKTLGYGADIIYPEGVYVHGDIFYNSALAGVNLKAQGQAQIKGVTGSNTLYWFGFTAADVVASTDTVVTVDGLRFDGDSKAVRAIMLYRTRFNPVIRKCYFTGFTGTIIRSRFDSDPNTDAGSSNVVALDISSCVFFTSGASNVAVELGHDAQVINIGTCYFRNDSLNPAPFVISEKVANLHIHDTQMLRNPQSAVDYSTARPFMEFNFGLGVLDINGNSFAASYPTTNTSLPAYMEIDTTGSAGDSFAVINVVENHFLDEGAHFHNDGYIHFVRGGARSGKISHNTFDTSYTYATGSPEDAPPIHFDNNFDMLFKSIEIHNNQWVNTGATNEDDLLVIKGGGGTNFRLERLDIDVNKQVRYQGAFTSSGDTSLSALLTKRPSNFLSSKYADTHRKFRYDASEEDTWIEVFNVVFATGSTSYVGCEFNMLMAAEAGGVQFYKILYQLQGSTGVASATNKGSVGTVPAGDGGDGTLPATTTDNIWWFEEDAANETVTFYVKKDDLNDVMEVEMSLLQVSNRAQAAGLVITWNEALDFEY